MTIIRDSDFTPNSFQGYKGERDWLVREMQSKHLDEVLAIEQISSLTPWSKKMFLEELQNPFACCLVCQNGDSNSAAVLGFACFQTIGEESELLNIAVHPSYRRMGIGKGLMQAYLHISQKMQVKAYYLQVQDSNRPAIRLYESFSYQPIGRRKKFYQGKFDALIMARKA